MQFLTETRFGIEYKINKYFSYELGGGYAYSFWKTTTCGECVFSRLKLRHGEGYAIRNSLKISILNKVKIKPVLKLEANYVKLNYPFKRHGLLSPSDEYFVNTSESELMYNIVFEAHIFQLKRFSMEAYLGYGIKYYVYYSLKISSTDDRLSTYKESYYWPTMGVSIGYGLY